MSANDGTPQQATFTLVVNDEHVSLTKEDQERILKAVQEVAGPKLKGSGPGHGLVSFSTWDRVATEVIDAHERFQVKSISAVAADMAHRS